MNEASENPDLNADSLELHTFCAVHPAVATTLRCNRCGRLMCTRCAVRTPVGYRCKECVRGQQDVFYTAANMDYVVAGIISIGISLVASMITMRFGLLFSIILGPAAGTLIAQVVLAAVRRRRGRYTGYIVAGGIVAGALPAIYFSLLGPILFAALAAGTAYSWFRYGR